MDSVVDWPDRPGRAPVFPGRCDCVMFFKIVYFHSASLQQQWPRANSMSDGGREGGGTERWGNR